MPALFVGYIAALIATLSFGSFAVPVKLPQIIPLNVHPLAFQSYKTLMCVCTAWLCFIVPVYNDEDESWSFVTLASLEYTPWGIISGLFWVPGGAMAIYAVQNAGLAVAQGTWSSLIVVVSFVWGILVFDEKVKNVYLAGLGVLGLVSGLVGMSVFSEGEKQPTPAKTSNNDNDRSALLAPELQPPPSTSNPYSPNSSQTPLPPPYQKSRIKGLLAAIFNGLWGGSIMVPMHYAPPEASGMGYVVSFAVGAGLVTILLWIILLIYSGFPNPNEKDDLRKGWSFKRGRSKLPSMHVPTMVGPGCLAGGLWAIGNISSMVTVQVLGEAVGYSICQTSLLVSGLWGIFYFQEVKGLRQRILWGSSAVVTLLGIILLTAEHDGSEAAPSSGGR
ncbi:hypothetical protein TrLO_g1824 [Triparma laevis f. longispina]|uniref:Uncharacterized protein n=1 Tax=Triparma laevis f. longispina TaxID=1714387 RepID=A0A9W7E7Z4_9STRA|nr:hypothetical protein TrLO_g1824 [Triparma laevis f. longispina]